MALPVCPACDHDGVRSIAELTAVPVFCNALWDDRAQARSAPVGDLDLVLCERCGLLWNRAFDEELTAYSPAYENSLHFSPAFQTFARSLAEDLVQRYDLHDTSVVEIGAGSGDFLAMVCELGDNRGIGYDPSHDPDRAVPGPVDVVAEHYPIDRPVDARLVCSRHVLEHVTEPIPLLEGVRGSLDPALDTVVYLEVPDATFMLDPARRLGPDLRALHLLLRTDPERTLHPGGVQDPALGPLVRRPVPLGRGRCGRTTHRVPLSRRDRCADRSR